MTTTTENAAIATWENEGGFVPPEVGVVGPVVNGERFAPGYTPEAAAYEQRTRGHWVVINLEEEVEPPEPARYTVDFVCGHWVVIDKHYGPSEVVENFGDDAEAATQHADWMNDACPRCGGNHDRITRSDCPLWQPSSEEIQS